MTDFDTRQCIRFLWKAIYELNESLHTGPKYEIIKQELIESSKYLREISNNTEEIKRKYDVY